MRIAEGWKLSLQQVVAVTKTAAPTQVAKLWQQSGQLLSRLCTGSVVRATLVCFVTFVLCCGCDSSLWAQATIPQKNSNSISFEDAEVRKVLGKYVKEFTRIKEAFKDTRDYEGEREALAEVGIPACEELWNLGQSKRDSVTELECLAGILRIGQDVSLILGKGGWLRDKAVDRLREAYLEHPRMRMIVAILRTSGLMESAELLQGIIDRHPDAGTRALAGWSLLYAGALKEHSSLVGVDRALLIHVCDLLTRNVADLPFPAENTLTSIKQARTKLESLDEGCAAMEIAGNSVSGKPFKLSDLRGKWVIVKFFGDNGMLAGLDKSNLADLRYEVQKAGMNEVAVLGVTGLSAAEARQVFPKSKDFHCIVGEDGARAIADWQVGRFFTNGATYIIDRRGIITHRDPFRPIALELEYVLSKERNQVKLLANDLVKTGAKWHYWDQGVSPAPDWHQPNFSTTNWKSGPSPLGYGISEVATKIAPQKQLKASPVCSWFRTEFEVKAAQPNSRYLLTIRADDAPVVWLNGVEVARSELLLDSATDQTPAQSHAETYGAVAAPQDYRIPRNLVRPGRNVLAVRLHQAEWSGMDAFMDATLTSEFPDPKQVPNTSWDLQRWAHNLECLEELTDAERATLQQLVMSEDADEYVRFTAFTTLVAAGARSGQLIDKLPSGFDDEQLDSLKYQVGELLPNLGMLEWRLSKQSALDLLPRAKAVTRLLPQDSQKWFTRAMLSYRAGEYAKAKSDLEQCVKLTDGIKDLPQHSLNVLIALKLGDKAAAQKAFTAAQQYVKSRPEWDIHRNDAPLWREASAAMSP